MRRPDFSEIERLRGIIQNHNMDLPPRDRIGPWRGQYQIDMMNAMLDNQWAVIQGIPQNSGKTYCASLISCARVLDGQNGVWCYPTLRQGARVAFRRVDNWMRILEEAEGVKRCQPDAAFEKAWENGGSLMVLSLDVSAKAGVQGYTLEFGFLDESHEITQVDDVIGAIFSRFDIAMQQGYGSVTLLGVGGARDSLIERAKHIEDFKAYKYPWQRVYADYEPARPSIDRAKRMLPLGAWEQFYELKPVAAGTRLIFNGLVHEIPVTGVARYAIGIDVGKTSDYTIGVRIELRRAAQQEGKTAVAIHDVICVPHNLKFREQAELLDPWIRQTQASNIPDGITVETNGLGAGLLDALQDLYPAVGGLHIEDNEKNTGYKSLLIGEAQVLSQWGRLACPPGIDVHGEIPDVHEHLEGLTCDVDETGHVTWEHSDVLSALIMALSGCDLD